MNWKNRESIKLLNIIISLICLIWAGIIGRRLFAAINANGLTKALIALFGVIGGASSWSVAVVWSVNRFWVVASHTFGMLSLAVVLEWIAWEMEQHREQ